MIGAVRSGGGDPGEIFHGVGHAPSPLDPDEAVCGGNPDEAWNLPDWLREMLVTELGADHAFEQARLLSKRAPITLRANSARMSRDALRRSLDGFDLRDNPLAPDALTVIGDGRGLSATEAFRDGLFEMQDASSQAVVAALDLPERGRILDFCAGGGGKTLAMAARTKAPVTAHDAEPARMKDLPSRAHRAGVQITVERDAGRLPPGAFDLVLLDVPCSGSGSWRRAPEAKWRLTPARLRELIETQRNILTTAQALVAPGGSLAYGTCSILPAENRAQCAWFVENFSDWQLDQQRVWSISDDGDGFFLSTMVRR